MSKQICTNCHFYCKQYRNFNGAEHIFEVSPEQRHKSKKGDFSWQRDNEALCCYKGIWNEGYRSGHKLTAEIVTIKRKQKCYFFEYQPGVFMQAAEKLQHESFAKSTEFEKYRLAIYGLLLTILTLAAKIISEKF